MHHGGVSRPFVGKEAEVFTAAGVRGLHASFNALRLEGTPAYAHRRELSLSKPAIIHTVSHNHASACTPTLALCLRE